MCFSAAASFSASVIILSIGSISLKKATDFPQKLLCSIPLIFGVQQFTEGLLWLSLTHPSLAYLHNFATYGFLFFAQVAWPIMLPFTMLELEKNTKVRKILKWFLILGLVVAAYLLFFIAFYPVRANISCYHIEYEIDYPAHIKHLGIFYLVVTIIPPLISGIKKLRFLGATILAAYIITQIFYSNYLISVWCYFAAIISIHILWVIVILNRPVTPVATNLQV